jgi:hypothetical protein
MEKVEGWDEVAATEALRKEGTEQVAQAWQAERKRCLALVQAEIKEGVARGIPMTSGTMTILYRIEAAIQNG